MAKRVLLVRHGEPDIQYQGRYLGATDVALSAEGLENCERLGVLLKKFKPAVCLCSPLERARRTAALVVGDQGLRPVIDEDLREIDFGRWVGLNFAEIAVAEPEAVERWARWESDFAFPGGEGLAAFRERTGNIANRLVNMDEDIVLAVSHGGVIRSLICYFLGLDQQQYLLFSVRYATVTVIDLYDGGRGVLTGFNLSESMNGRRNNG